MTTGPNVLILEADQLNPAVLGCYGGPVDTPNIDRLAEEGARFTNVSCPTPLCSPSRASISTGQYPHTHGITHNCMRGYVAATTQPTETGITRDDETMGKRLHEAGYTTHHYGKWHLEDDHLPYYDDQFTEHRKYAQEMADRFRTVRQRAREKWMDWYGWALPVTVSPELEAAVESTDDPWFDHDSSEFITKMGRLELPPEETFDARVADHAIERLENADDPWFLTCSFNYPHDPNVVPDPYYGHYDPATIDMPDPDECEDRFKDDVSRRIVAEIGEPGLREFLRCYYAAVELIDDQVGRVLDSLEREGQMENTVIVFLADHGDMAGEHGMVWKSTNSFYDGIAQVPLIVRLPDAESPNVLDVPCDLTDVLPTILDITDVTIPDQVQGESLLPYLRDDVDPKQGERYGFGEYVNSDPLKTRRVPDDTEGSFMIRGRRWKYILYSDGEEFLYDLEMDPGETKNQISNDDPDVQDARDRLRNELVNWLHRTDYPGTLPESVR